MNTLFIIIGVGAVGYLIYLFLGDTDEDIIEQRLMGLPKQNKEVVKKKRNAIVDDIKKLILFIIEPIIFLIREKQSTASFKQLLLEAGLPSNDDDVSRLIFNKILFGVFGLILGIFVAIVNKSTLYLSIPSLFIIPYTFYRFPNFSLKRIAKKRCTEIVYSLPDSLDLLTVCVEAGLGLDMAITRVAEEQVRLAPILANEFVRVGKDILSGVSRQDAFRNLSNRNNVAELKTFTALLIQTDKLGTSIAQSLRVYSDSVRIKRRQRIETVAAQASVKMIIPLVLFILPSMFVVLLAPAVISLIHNFKSSGL